MFSISVFLHMMLILMIIQKINSQDIRKMNINQVRSHMALVSQEATLFNISIRNNIKYGDLTRDVLEGEVILATRQANIHDFIHTLAEVGQKDIAFFD
jgi:ATP-binding cassette subfamily B (MDR/TAP) protein 1